VARVYRLDTRSGTTEFVNTLVSDPADVSSPYTTLTGTRFGFDFNPVVDRLRIVSDGDTNLRMNVANGLVTSDGTLNPGTPNVVAAAYANNFAGTATTTLYVIDSDADALYIQNPPNNGTLTLVGILGVDAGDIATFDISAQPSPGNAFATLVVGGVARLYSIDLATGAATSLGAIAGNPTMLGMTVSRAGTVFASGFE
jgi:hypothetical protein